jgi:lipoprotein signal peptidase
VLGALSHAGVVAMISWDPFIRGIVILALFIILLPGSVYLVVATNTGARLGFLIGAAGLSGMIALLSIFWVVLNSTADIGRANAWKPLAIVTGNFADQVTVKGVQDFPADNLKSAKSPVLPLKSTHWFWPFQQCPDNSGWYNLSTAKQTDAESAADKVLAPTAAAGPAKSNLTTPFSATTDYTYLGGYEENPNGGCLFAWDRHKVYLPFGRGGHYEVVLAQPVLPVVVPAGAAPPAPKPDPTKPVTYVVLVRDLGSLHEPQVITAASSLIIFGILCNILHKRDKDIWARQEEERRTAAGAAPPREKVGAST